MNIKWLFGALILISVSSACKDDNDDITPEDDLIALNMALGNPSDATTNIIEQENYLMELPQYVISYSRSRGTPNWVSWYLSEEWLGNTSRQDDFRPNDALPPDWYRVDQNDYNYSLGGFDRGHNCPSADRTSSRDDNSATFLMTNMIPQAPKHNQELWNDLEQFCRDQVYRGNELYIIMGSYGAGGTGDNGYREKLAGGLITVPRYIWKVIVVLPLEDGNDLDRIDEETRIIAVLTENKNTAASKHWSTYRVSIDEIEDEANLDLLSNLSANMQHIIEAQVDDGPIQ